VDPRRPSVTAPTDFRASHLRSRASGESVIKAFDVPLLGVRRRRSGVSVLRQQRIASSCTLPAAMVWPPESSPVIGGVGPVEAAEWL